MGEKYAIAAIALSEIPDFWGRDIIPPLGGSGRGYQQ
jgi:hypothetical protein